MGGLQRHGGRKNNKLRAYDINPSALIPDSVSFPELKRNASMANTTTYRLYDLFGYPFRQPSETLLRAGNIPCCATISAVPLDNVGHPASR